MFLLTSSICMANRNYWGPPLTPVSIYRERLGTWSLWESRGHSECFHGYRLRFPANGQEDGSCLEVLYSPGRPSIGDPSWKCCESQNASPQCTWKERILRNIWWLYNGNTISYTVLWKIFTSMRNLEVHYDISSNLSHVWVENSI